MLPVQLALTGRLQLKNNTVISSVPAATIRERPLLLLLLLLHKAWVRTVQPSFITSRNINTKSVTADLLPSYIDGDSLKVYEGR